MNLTSDFLQEFQPALDQIALPEAAAPYQLVSCFSQSETGSVWLIRRRSGGEPLILRMDSAMDLQAEFQLMKRLPQDLSGQTPQPVDFFQEDGMQYLVRTYLPGTSLAELGEDGPWTETRCAALGRQLCALLERLHRLDPPLIHRDIKPENIILSPDGVPGLIDFGIARSYDPALDTDTVHMGTRATAAPEQYGFAQSDQRTDLYSLGVTLRWLLTGSYRPEDLEKSSCSAGMKRFLRKAAAFDPDARFPTAAAMGGALAALARPPRLRRRRRLAAGLAAALAALLLAAGGLFPRREKPVQFASPLLEEAVRRELDRPDGPLTREDLEQVRRLAVVGQEMPEESCQFACRLSIFLDGIPQDDRPRGDIAGLSPLAEMPNLTVLYLCRQEISDLTPLTGLPLRELYLTDNQISDFSPLAELPELEVLYIGSNPAAGLSPLAELTSLRRLNLDSWNVHSPDSLAPLADLPLEYLSLGNLRPQDGSWSALGAMPRLGELWLWDPPEEALSALADCGALYGLNLGNCQTADLSSLPPVPNLDSLSIFNRLPSLAGVEKQADIRYLNLCNLTQLDLSPAAGLEELREMNIFNVQPLSYAPLAELPALEQVYVDTPETAAAVERECPDRRFAVAVS